MQTGQSAQPYGMWALCSIGKTNKREKREKKNINKELWLYAKFKQDFLLQFLQDYCKPDKKVKM